MSNEGFRSIGQALPKKDAAAHLTGKPVYTDDIVSTDRLCVKLLRSRYANAILESIDVSAAMRVPGVAAIYTWQDVPQIRYTIAGQTYPEFSPYDHLILDRHVRYAGDPVAIIAAESEKAALKAMRLIRVAYQVLPAVLDFRTAKDNPVIVHPEDDWFPPFQVGGDPKRNLVSSGSETEGDVDAVFASCDTVIERTYHTKAFHQVMMETFRTYCEIDACGRLRVISSTQIAFHCRRIIARALGIPMNRVRVEIPGVGGGFGAKQSAVSEVYAAFVTWKTGRPCELVYTREECQIAGSPRHEMEITVRLGANRDGTIRALDVYTLSNTGAYGEHGPTTVGLSGHKPIAIYSANLEAYRFSYDVVYTNLQASGAYRGYGATQGVFAVESAVNEIADLLGMDPCAIREKNMVRRGMRLIGYDGSKLDGGERANAIALDRCLRRCGELFHWDEKYPVRDMGNGKVRSAGVAMALQGSGIAGVDTGSATVKLVEDGTYVLITGAADIGTGCMTILSQIAAERLECNADSISVHPTDTDVSPYDSGTYASATTYVTGKAVELACEKLKNEMCGIAAGLMGCGVSDVEFLGDRFIRKDSEQCVSLRDVGFKGQFNSTKEVEATVTYSSPCSPPPYIAGMAEIELDRYTGKVDVLNFVNVVDCGTVINPAAARVQAEGGIVQGIGHTLMEDIHYGAAGRPIESSLLQYRIPARTDVRNLRVEFEASNEATGPGGAKSIGEVVLSTPAPAIAHAISRAAGRYFRELPITPEQIAMADPE